MTEFQNNSPISIFFIGCDNYVFLDNLTSVRQDLDRMRQILIDSDYSIFDESQITELYNRDSQAFRELLSDFLYTRSAERDSLILVFCGHGTAIGRDDFGFCLQDAFKHPEDDVILSTSVVKLSEIISCLKIKDISLMLIVDACYSGQISRQMVMNYVDIVPEMSKSLMISLGGNFGLITSCSDTQQVLDIGVISRALKDFAEQGSDETNKEYLTFGDLAETLAEGIDIHGQGDSRSRIIIPPGKMSKTRIFYNVQYHIPVEPLINYSFTNPYLKILLALWNNGNRISLTPREILEQTGSQSAYANHNKLSFECWGLVEDNETGERVITNKGIQFLQGEISIPKIITVNKDTRESRPALNSPLIQVSRGEDLFGNEKYFFTEIDSQV